MEDFRAIIGFAELFWDVFINFSSAVIDTLGNPIGNLLNVIADIDGIPAILSTVLSNGADFFSRIPVIGDAPLIGVMLGAGVYILIAVWIVKFILSWI